MPRSFSSTVILVVVFALGLSAGIGGMVWAWPGLQAKYFPHKHQPFIQVLQKRVKLTPQQVPQVEAVLSDVSARNHANHLLFRPQYAKICDEYNQVRKQERDAYAPIREQELDKLHAIFTPEQWQTFQSDRAAAQRPPHQPDVCRNLYPATAPAPATPHK